MALLSDVLLKTETIQWKKTNESQVFEYVDLSSVDRIKHEISNTTRINSTNAPSRAQKIIREADVLFGTTRPTLERLCIVNKPLDGQICSTGLCVLRADQNEIMPSYIYYLLSTPKFLKHIEGLQRGASYPAVTDKDVKNFEFNLPSLDDQKRIVAKLNTAFIKINKAVELTLRNINNTKLLITKLINDEIAANQSFPSTQLGSVCHFVRGPFGGSLKKDIFKDSGYAVYEQRHAIRDDFSIIRYYIDQHKFNEMRRFELRPNDLIMSCSGTIGKIAIAPSDIQPGIINQALLKFTPDQEKLDAQYLRYWIESDVFQSMLGVNMGGAAIKNIASVQVLKQLPIALPPLSIQHTTVSKITALLNQKRHLLKSQEDKTALLGQLKRSLLIHDIVAGEIR